MIELKNISFKKNNKIMINNPLTQLKEFSFCLLAGAVAAVIYEIFYIIRFVFGFHKLIEFFLDIIYIVISGLIFFFTVASLYISLCK